MAQGTTKGVPIDIDPTLAADSDLLVPSQKAIKTYVDTNFLNPSDLSATTPLTYSSSTGVFTINQASSLSNGYLTSTDWSTFNGKGSGTVTSVAALTLGTSGTDLGSSVATGTTTPVITLNVPTASATNRGALSSTDWSTFNNKQNAITLTTTGTSGAATLSVGGTLNIPQYSNTSVYLKNSTTYTTTTATGTQVLASVLIPGNTFVAGDVLRVTARVKKTGTTNSGNFAIGINTVLSPSGAVTFKTNSIVATYPAFGVFAHAVIINATTNTQLPWPATNYGTNDIGFATAVSAGAWQENVAINWTVPQYIIFQCSLQAPTLDSASLIFYMIEKL